MTQHATPGSKPRPIPARCVRADDLIAFTAGDPLGSPAEIVPDTDWFAVCGIHQRDNGLLEIRYLQEYTNTLEWTFGMLEIGPDTDVVAAEPRALTGDHIARLAWHLYVAGCQFGPSYDASDAETMTAIAAMWANARTGPAMRQGYARRAHELLSAALSGPQPPTWP